MVVMGFVRGAAYRQRLDACRTCPDYRPEDQHCLRLHGKCAVLARFAHQTCPADRWQPLEDADPDLLTEGQAVRTACRHRGEPVDALRCPDCTGRITLKVFQCALHGRCLAGRSLGGFRGCHDCADYGPARRLEDDFSR